MNKTSSQSYQPIKYRSIYILWQLFIVLIEIKDEQKMAKQKYTDSQVQPISNCYFENKT